MLRLPITPSLVRFLRQSATYVGVEVFLNWRLNNKDDVVLGFQSGNNASITCFVCYRFAIDGGDDRSFAKSNLVGERTGPDIRNNDSAFDADLGRQRRGDRRYSDAEFAFSSVGFLRRGGIIRLTSNIRVCLGAISDNDIGAVLLAVAEVPSNQRAEQRYR
jgi:hypothetical protein